MGGEQVDVLAVVLDLPAKLCISLSVKRTCHQGNLQGGKAAAVVNHMIQKKELPKLAKDSLGLHFVRMEWMSNQDAVEAYSGLGPFDSISYGVFGQKNLDTKLQLGMMKFLKKAETPNDASDGSKLQCDGKGSQGSASKLECPEKDPYPMAIENKNENREDITRKDSMKKASSGDTTLHDILTLAFPSISTSDFQFDHGKASDIIAESVANFLSKVDNVRLVLVDINLNSHILSMVKAKAAKKNIDPSWFFTFVGDITRLHTEGNLKCATILPMLQTGNTLLLM